MEDQFLYVYHKFLTEIRGEALAETPNPAALKSATPVVASMWGWQTFLDDPDFAATITEFTLVQLGWLVAIAERRGSSLAVLPDWMCREPARWLSHLARVAPSCMKPRQAEKAIEYATSLLKLATSAPAVGHEQFSFSPMVVASLIQIASSFVQAGVSRARKKREIHRRRGFGSGVPDEEDDLGDDRELDVYSSFDRNDLGVTVFTNSVVKTELCPTLLRTFRAVDVVEGFDADRDDSLEKSSVKAQIAELLLWLYAHPSGECRESVASLPATDILPFASSLSLASGVMLDFAIESLEKLQTTAQGRPLHALRGMEKSFVDQQWSSLVGQLQMTRKYLVLFCTVSGDDRISSILGGHGLESQQSECHLVNLSSMIIHFIEKLTSRDGGTNKTIEIGRCDSTSGIAARLMGLSDSEKASLAEDVVSKRTRSKVECGLDIASLCFQLLALAANWHLAAVEVMKGKTRVSPILTAMVENEDCDLEHLENVYRRLVLVPEGVAGSERDNVWSIFQHDGYVDRTAWEHKYIDSSVSESQKGYRRRARQDQLKQSDVAKAASYGDIAAFLDDLKFIIAEREHEARKKVLTRQQVELCQNSIMSNKGSSTEDAYGGLLAEWVVSSSPFRAGAAGSTFCHKYNQAAQNHTLGSGKVLVKEARKCHKMLPFPTANSSIFVCFAEERMDLCRAVVSGPVDTPYAHGLFEFDTYFPPSYPQVPPLVAFMTTGGGQIRFNPNLYVDGKICISLLNATTASDESQRWNPDHSSLAQVLISVQSQILGVHDPYFNEGNGVPMSMKLTPDGMQGSFNYNNRVRLATLRHAIVGHLRSAPKGFDEVIERHFAMCRKRIVVQARRWMLEARDADLFCKYERTYADLVELLSAESMSQYDSLAPLPEDLKALDELDPSFAHLRRCSTSEDDQKPLARESSGVSFEPSFNPWAASVETSTVLGSSSVVAPEKNGNKDYDTDDELYV